MLTLAADCGPVLPGGIYELKVVAHEMVCALGKHAEMASDLARAAESTDREGARDRQAMLGIVSKHIEAGDFELNAELTGARGN